MRIKIKNKNLHKPPDEFICRYCLLGILYVRFKMNYTYELSINLEALAYQSRIDKFIGNFMWQLETNLYS